MSFFHPLSKIHAGRVVLALVGLVGLTALAMAEVPHQFQAGETASAEEVNANFSALVDTVSALEARVESLETEVSELEDENADLQAELDALSDEVSAQGDRVADIEDSDLFERENFVVDLDKFLEIHLSQAPTDTTVEAPLIRVAGANLQIVNAAGEQATPDGTGNLVVGLAEARTFGAFVCSDGTFEDSTDCRNAGERWARAHSSGSHNIVGGSQPSFSQTGGLVVGRENVINRVDASVSGGESNIASGRRASVSGGEFNTASGTDASVSGGIGNTASGDRASVSGGRTNTASGLRASVSGGELNIASGRRASVSGGTGCEVSVDDGWGAQRADGTSAGDC